MKPNEIFDIMTAIHDEMLNIIDAVKLDKSLQTVAYGRMIYLHGVGKQVQSSCQHSYLEYCGDITACQICLKELDSVVVVQ